MGGDVALTIQTLSSRFDRRSRTPVEEEFCDENLYSTSVLNRQSIKIVISFQFLSNIIGSGLNEMWVPLNFLGDFIWLSFVVGKPLENS